ncbi:30S ribosomal protein S20 [Kosmotoga arenicorallina S304]|uniref:Small ribosomal subunit protein bS20 n=1 Tax=Kosmotoga arenicorallina S304 TaxID=1453497 RepID=A0A176K124_9BACT|nr:30S ribosomal protein S20 [Kosmotoga arenicorallina]OAA30106.1 30S ribosomal protein S20 [Kosmotoga arenicorallina S304]
MPNIKSAEKRVRQTKVRRMRNRSAKTRFRNVTKELLLAIETKEAPEKVNELLSLSFSVLDRAAKKGVIHKRQASRRKARLTARVKKYLDSLS